LLQGQIKLLAIIIVTMIDYQSGNSGFFGPLETVGIRIIADDRTDPDWQICLICIDQLLQITAITR